MTSMTPFGLRRTVDLTAEFSEYVVDSMTLINDALGKDGRAFIFDTVDVHQQVIGEKHLWDMFGWMGDVAAASAALDAWNSGDDSLLDDLDYVSVSWLEENGVPKMELQ